MRRWHSLCLIFIFCFGAAAAEATSRVDELEQLIAQEQWDAAAQLANELASRSDAPPIIRVHGAFALFQKGYAHSALSVLKKISLEDWKRIPHGQDRLSEIVLLFQKKVPMAWLPARIDQISGDDDGIRFAKGRSAFEAKNWDLAISQLNSVSHGSRYYTQAAYLLASIATTQGRYDEAIQQFSRIFDSSMLSKSSEFWQDVGAERTRMWGSHLRVEFSSQGLEDAAQVGELGVLGLARTYYAKGDYLSAGNNYNKVSPQSKHYPRSVLEKTWALLSRNLHEEAQKSAADLASQRGVFEALEARALRALVLVDAGKTSESRTELDAFQHEYNEAYAKISDWMKNHDFEFLPTFLKSETAQDGRMKALERYEASWKKEIDALSRENQRSFPVYSKLFNELLPAQKQIQSARGSLVQELVARRKGDLTRVWIRSKLVRAESYLEDRERLREKFKELPEEARTKNMADHDLQMFELLRSAVQEIDEVSPKIEVRNLPLEFRQSELLWELGSSAGIMFISTRDAKYEKLADQYRNRALSIAKSIADHDSGFKFHARSVFFSGYMMSDLGRWDESERALEKFVTKYPEDENAPDAYRMLGDTQFDKNKFAEAQKYYEKILRFPQSSVAGYALYKIGWCAYNLKAFAKALLALEKSYIWARDHSETGSLSLSREAKSDLITIYAELGDASKGWQYFQQISPVDTQEWISLLAEELDKNGQYEKSAILYEALLNRDSSPASQVRYRAAILKGAYHLRQWPRVLAIAEEIRTRNSEFTSAIQKKDEGAVFSESALKNALVGLQMEGRKAHSAEAIDQAIRLGDIYLQLFSGWENIEESFYLHSAYLLENGKMEAAAVAFKKYWELFSPKLAEPRKENALRLYLNALQTLEDANKTAAPQISEATQRMLTLSDEYAQNYPVSQYRRQIRFLKSTILLKYGKVDEALPLTQELFLVQPMDEIGKKCFKNLRVAYYDKKMWGTAYDWASSLLTRKEPAIQVYFDDLRTIREESAFLRAESIPAPKEAAEVFLKIAADPEMKRLHEKALYQAFQKLNQQGDKIRALEVADQIEKDHSQFEGLREISGIRSAFYQEAGDYRRSLVYLEQLIQNPPKELDPAVLTQAKANAALVVEALAERKKIQKKTLIEPEIWGKLMKAKTAFEKSPLPKKGSMAEKIRKGAEELEKVTQPLIDYSSNPEAPTYFAMEAYCALPFLYQQFAAAVLDFNQMELLDSVVKPLRNQAQEFSSQCIQKGTELGHHGPNFEKALSTWGWKADAQQAGVIEKIIQYLDKKLGWLDSVGDLAPEDQILKQHHSSKSDENSWYTLGVIRFQKNEIGLARLTWVDAYALAKKNQWKTGRLMNALAVIEDISGEPEVRLESLYEQAIAQGSVMARFNLAKIHFKAGRLESGAVLLKQAIELGGPAHEHAQLEPWVKEVMQWFAPKK